MPNNVTAALWTRSAYNCSCVIKPERRALVTGLLITRLSLSFLQTEMHFLSLGLPPKSNAQMNWGNIRNAEKGTPGLFTDGMDGV